MKTGHILVLLNRCLSSSVLGIFALAAHAASADEKNPYTMADNTWITISGTVDSVHRDNFTLRYGDGEDAVIVEMDDGDRDADAYTLLKGDAVTVSGVIDDDLYELTKIEAGSAYVKSFDKTYFASTFDDETAQNWVATLSIPSPVTEAVFYGTVMAVTEDTITLDSRSKTLRVDVAWLDDHPLDNVGYQRIEVGDWSK